MELVAIIVLATVVAAGAVFLWRSTPSRRSPEPSVDDEAAGDKLVDIHGP